MGGSKFQSATCLYRLQDHGYRTSQRIQLARRSCYIFLITRDISIFLSTDLDNRTEEILAADGIVLPTRASGTIALATLVNRNHSFIHLHNMHCCPEIDTNLLSLGALEAKGLQISAKNMLLEVQDPNGNVVLQARRHNNVYPLL